MKRLLFLSLILSSAVPAQTRTSLTLCPRASVAVGDTFVVKKSATNTLCIAKPTPPVITPPPVVVDTVKPPAVVQPPGVSVEPIGMTTIAERDFSLADQAGWYRQMGYAGALTQTEDLTAPRSQPGVTVQNYTSQLSGGSSPGSLGFGIPYAQQPRILYVSAYMKISNNFLGHPGNVNKVIHFYTWGGNRMIFILRGSGMNPLAPGFNTQSIGAPYTFVENGQTITGSKEANLHPNVNSCAAIRGVWHRYEIILTHNMPGVADGRAELWMDSKKCLDYSGIMYAPAGQNGKWEEVNWSPTYGGGSVAITTPFQMFMDHMKVSGR